MSYILVIDQPNLGDAGEIHIYGLGTFKNGEHEVSDEQAQQFRVLNHQYTYEDQSQGEQGGTWPQVTGTVLGPDLPTAVETMYGVTVREAGGSDTGTGGDQA